MRRRPNMRGDIAIKGAIALAVIAGLIFAFVFIRRTVDKPKPVEASVAQVPVKFTSVPAGAAIEVDGRASGSRTPAELVMPVRTAHEVRFVLDGYEPATASFIAVDGAAPVTAELSKLVTATIETTPPGAKVMRGNDVLVAETPGSFHVTAGVHPIIVSKEGFVPATVEQRIDQASTTVSVTLTKAAYLDVQSDREGAKIFIDDKDTGLLTPAERIAVSAGTAHTVVVRKEDDFSVPRKVAKLAPGKTLKLSLKLTNEHQLASDAEDKQIRAQVKKLTAEKKKIERELPKYFGRNSAKHQALEQRLEEINAELDTLGVGEGEM